MFLLQINIFCFVTRQENGKKKVGQPGMAAEVFGLSVFLYIISRDRLVGWPPKVKEILSKAPERIIR